MGSNGRISLCGFQYLAGRWLAGEVVEIESTGGLVQLFREGALIRTHARRHQPGKEPTVARAARLGPPKPATTGPSVLRMVDGSGSVSFAGWSYRVGNTFKRRQVEVAIVDKRVQLAVDGKVIKTHPIRHDRTKEHGAFATPRGRPRKKGSAA